MSVTPIAQPGRSVTWIDLEPLSQDHGIPLAAMGILVVFAALVLVSLFVSGLPKLVALIERHLPDSEVTASTSPPPTLGDDVSEETLVVLAAAVAAVIDQPHRIIHSRQLTAEDLAWSLEGRLQHHTSHRPQLRNQ